MSQISLLLTQPGKFNRQVVAVMYSFP